MTMNREQGWLICLERCSVKSLKITLRYAIVTLDGTVLLVDHGTKDPMDSIMWNLQVSFSWF